MSALQNDRMRISLCIDLIKKYFGYVHLHTCEI